MFCYVGGQWLKTFLGNISESFFGVFLGLFKIIILLINFTVSIPNIEQLMQCRYSEAFSEHCETSKMELSAKIA